MIKEVMSEADMKAFGAAIGGVLRGGEVIELIGDVGAGKTTLVKGIAAGLKIDEDVQSPTFTISRVYTTPRSGAIGGTLELAHYDFYRLSDPGIMANELHETINDPQTITIIEWAEIVSGVLPDDRISITITAPTESSRTLDIDASGPRGQAVLGAIA